MKKIERGKQGKNQGKFQPVDGAKRGGGINEPQEKQGAGRTYLSRFTLRYFRSQARRKRRKTAGQKKGGTRGGGKGGLTD